MKKAVAVTVAVLLLLAGAVFAVGRYLGYSPGNPFENARENLPFRNRDRTALEESLDIAPHLDPVSPAEFDLLMTAPQHTLTPKEPELEAAAWKGISGNLYQGLIVAQGSGRTKVYVGKLEDVQVGQWLLKQAHEYGVPEGGSVRQLIAVPEQSADIQSIQVIAWTNLPNEHPLILALESQLRAQP